MAAVSTPTPLELVTDARRFGIIGDGVTDDSAAIQRAIDRGLWVSVPRGTFVINSTISLETVGQKLFGAGPGRTTLLYKAASGAAVSLDADNCKFEGITVSEDGSSATANGADVGIRVQGSHCLVSDVKVSGFDKPITIRSTAELHYDNNTLRDVEVSGGYDWGVEVDSSRYTSLVNVVAHSNGSDGIKVLNSAGRTCDGLTILGGECYNNGLRDTVAGGSETNWNGNGIDFYDGGFRFSVIGLHCHDNYGSGFNFKGDASDVDIEVQGEGSLIGCHAHNNKTNSSGSVHGFEFNVGGDTSGSLVTLTNCHAGGNTGFGLSVLGGFGHSITGGSYVENLGGGVRFAAGSRDASICGASVLGNTGIGIQVGLTSDGTYLPRRLRIRDCTVAGLYDKNLATGSDPRSATGTKVTTSGIRVYSDSADVLIDGCEIRDTTAHGIYSLGHRVTVRSSTLFDCPGGSIRGGSGSLLLRDVRIEDTDFSVNGTMGAIYTEACTADIDRVTLVQSSSTNSRVMRLNNAAADVTLGSIVATNYTNTAVQVSSGTLRAGRQYGDTAVSAAADPGTAIPETAKHVTVTSGNADHVVILPAPVAGKVLTGYVGSNGCEFYASGSSVNINGVVCSATNEAAMPANSLWRAECVSATDWILTYTTSAGAAGSTITPDSRS